MHSGLVQLHALGLALRVTILAPIRGLFSTTGSMPRYTSQFIQQMFLKPRLPGVEKWQLTVLPPHPALLCILVFVALIFSNRQHAWFGHCAIYGRQRSAALSQMSRPSKKIPTLNKIELKCVRDRQERRRCAQFSLPPLSVAAFGRSRGKS